MTMKAKNCTHNTSVTVNSTLLDDFSCLHYDVIQIWNPNYTAFCGIHNADQSSPYGF